MGTLPGTIQRDGRVITRLARAHDASHFLLTPTEVVTPKTIDEVAELMADSNQTRQPLTFRSGGTSLCGQAVTDGILVDTRRHFRDVEVLDGGLRVRAGAGATLAAVNARLAHFGRRLGPDPTSAIACTIGGILANNSGGMLSGTTQNSYATLESMVFVLPDGYVVDTAAHGADIDVRLEQTELVGGLHALRRRLRTNPDTVAQILRLFSMKNTMGYGINALLDFHRPIDIISHLLIGSEGTLGFIAEATFRTVPLARHSAAALALFPTLHAATAALSELDLDAFEAVELMDVAALRAVRHRQDAPAVIREATLTSQAALLLELHDTTAERLEERLSTAGYQLNRITGAEILALTTDPEARTALVELRRSLYALVAGDRASGTTTLLEDISVPRESFADMCAALDDLFARHGYGVLNVPLFAHAKDGNIHFLLSERFGHRDGLLRYRKFTRALVRAVLQRGGVLKAKHGTGRAMAPFVQEQYGEELYQVMRAIKHLFDPQAILNPGVIISDDPDEHLRNLKLMPTIEPEVDACIECGYCEAGCPSRDLTLTPRQRIVLRREMVARADDTELMEQLQRDYQYEAVETCAVDGMCSVACPLGIDTGALVRNQRAANVGAVELAGWTSSARTWGLTTRLAASALTVARSTSPLARAATRLGRRALGDDAVPIYADDLPPGSGLRRRPRRRDRNARGVAAYFPSCLQTMFAPTGEGVFRAFRELCLRGGVRVTLLDAGDLCCGAPWRAKGMAEGYNTMRDKVHAELNRAEPSRLVTDAASCTTSLQAMTAEWGVEVDDVVTFVAREILPTLTLTRPLGSLALHPTCSSTQLGINDDLRALADFMCDDVVVPDSWSCCGFAGDRGLLHPELTASATADMAAELSGRRFAAYASLNRTCELGMSRATGQDYRHILELLEEATRP